MLIGSGEQELAKRRDRTQSFFSKAFGGLSASYYLRQLFFGSLPPLMILSVVGSSSFSLMDKPVLIVLCVVSTLVYPYSRFVYERAFEFLVGNKEFGLDSSLMMYLQILTIMICWGVSIFLAPIGLTYLYRRNSR